MSPLLSMVRPLVAGLLGLGMVLALIPLILRGCARLQAFDRARDLHHTDRRPIPRLGGLALAAAFVGLELFVRLIDPEQRLRTPAREVIFLSCLAMFGLGFWDDLRGLGARMKLLGQLLISLVVCWCGLGVQDLRLPFIHHDVALHAWATVVTVLWLVGMTNLVNLIDGADGLAGGICLMLMVLIAYVGYQVGHLELLAAGMAGALLGFLWFNFPPARIYLGNGGAYLLGFQIGLFSVVNSHKGEIFAALAAPLLALALPVLDTGLSILRRGMWGLPVLRPDRLHFHHHLQRIGFSRRKVLFSFYGVTLVFLLLGFAAVWSRGQWVPGLLGLVVLVLLICARTLSSGPQWFDVGRVVGNSLEMRREIQYALSLTRWLELEGGRRASLDDLWLDLVFAAQKLGFSSVKLTLADGERAWAQPLTGQPVRSIRQELDGANSGVLELATPVCELMRLQPPDAPDAPSCRRLCPCVCEAKLFEVLTALLAEAWTRSVARWKNGRQAPLRFDARTPLPKEPMHDATGLPAGAAPLLKPNGNEEGGPGRAATLPGADRSLVPAAPGLKQDETS